MIIQERQVRSRLREDFEPLIDVSDLQSHPESTIAEMRTSRALAALCIAAKAKTDAREAAQCVVDESGDRGIDAAGVSVTEETVYLVQAKSGGGSPSLTEVQKFISGLRLILNSDWDHLGAKLKSRRGEIEQSLEYRNARVVAIYTHLGESPITEDVKNESDNFKKEINAAGEILDFQYMDLRHNFDNRNAAQGEGALNYDLDFKTWGTLGEYRSEVFGVVAVGEIANLVESFGDRLYDRNIRNVLHSSSVNDALDDTIRRSPESFWYFNNGITIVASRITADKLRPRSSDQTFNLSGLNVVNGAQTCGAIYRAFKDGADLQDAYVTVRVISTEQRPEDFENNVTRYTNTQNQVGGREFVSLDPWQQEIRDTLNAEGIQYCFKTGDTPDLKNFTAAFDLEEATRALACLGGVSLATQAKREIGRMWSDITKDPYTKIFDRSNDPATIYNAVEFWRCVNAIIEDRCSISDARTGKILSHSAYLVTSLLFSWLGRSITISNIQEDIHQAFLKNSNTIEKFLVEVIRQHELANPNGYPQSFFKNQAKVELMESSLRKHLFQTTVAV